MPIVHQKTTLVKNRERAWYVVDAEGQILGRMATQIATLLMGKHRPNYASHVDMGDFVIVTNAEKFRLSGKKAETKTYESYSYYPGGRRVVSLARMMAKKPEKAVSEAVRRMLPKSKLGRQMFSKLKVYAGPDHPHGAQQPEAIKLD